MSMSAGRRISLSTANNCRQTVIKGFCACVRGFPRREPDNNKEIAYAGYRLRLVEPQILFRLR